MELQAIYHAAAPLLRGRSCNSGSNPVSARCGQAQPSGDISHIAQRDQASAMFGSDDCRMIVYGRMANCKQRCEFFMGEHYRLQAIG